MRASKRGPFFAFALASRRESGRGSDHTFLDNTDKNVLLLVGGEANKKENKLTYPFHLEEMSIKKNYRL